MATETSPTPPPFEAYLRAIKKELLARRRSPQNPIDIDEKLIQSIYGNREDRTLEGQSGVVSAEKRQQLQEALEQLKQTVISHGEKDEDLANDDTYKGTVYKIEKKPEDPSIKEIVINAEADAEDTMVFLDQASDNFPQLWLALELSNGDQIMADFSNRGTGSSYSLEINFQEADDQGKKVTYETGNMPFDSMTLDDYLLLNNVVSIAKPPEQD